MTSEHARTIARELTLTEKQVQACEALLDEGATVPFISRYRKEAAGSLDEVAVTAIRDRFAQLRELDKRREAILKSLEETGKLTEELKARVLAAETMTALEDIYLPYRPKRRTKATVAPYPGHEEGRKRRVFDLAPDAVGRRGPGAARITVRTRQRTRFAGVRTASRISVSFRTDTLKIRTKR